MVSMKQITIGLFLFLLGFGIGYLLRYQDLDPSIQQVVGIVIAVFTSSFGVLRIMPLIQNWRDKKEEKKIRQDKLILTDLENWMKLEGTVFTNIRYNFVKVIVRNHKDPEDLPFYDKDIELLKKYNAFSLWEKGKTSSEKLTKEGAEALKTFHTILDKALEEMPLKKSLAKGKLLEPYYSVPRVRETIFKGIKGEHIELGIDEQGCLYYGSTSIACGDTKVLNRLKKIINNLIQDSNVMKEIEIYNKAQRKLNLREPFSEFERKIKEIITKFHWNEKF